MRTAIYHSNLFIPLFGRNGWEEKRKRATISRCSLSLLVCRKARNTTHENIFRLCGVKTLSSLVDLRRIELRSYKVLTRTLHA